MKDCLKKQKSSKRNNSAAKLYIRFVKYYNYLMALNCLERETTLLQVMGLCHGEYSSGQQAIIIQKKST